MGHNIGKYGGPYSVKGPLQTASPSEGGSKMDSPGRAAVGGTSEVGSLGQGTRYNMIY